MPRRSVARDGGLLVGAPRRFSLIEASGDSYGQGVGSLDKQHGYQSILASMLGIPLINRSIGGAVAAWPIQDLNTAGDGGWANVLQSVTTPNVAAPYMPLHSLVSLSYAGFNDMWDNGHAAAIPMFISAMRLIISRYRAAAMFPYTYFTSVASASVVATTRSGDGLLALKSTASGMTAKFTVPADVPAGCVPVLYGEVAPGSSGTLSFTVNGVHSAGNDISLDGIANVVATANVANGWCARFPQCVAGDQIVMTATYSAGFIELNGAMIEAANPPIVITHGCDHPPVVASSYGWASTAAMNADIDTLNTAHQALVAEFDSHVIYYDLVAVLPQVANGTAGSLYASDNLHPLAKGHALIAQAALKAAYSVSLTTDQIADMALYSPRGTLGPQLRQRTVPQSYPYQVLLTDEYVGVLGSGARTLTLPDATLAGPGASQTVGTKGFVQSLTIKDEVGNAAAGNITVACLNSQTIDGAATAVIATNGGALTLISTGLEWVTVGANAAASGLTSFNGRSTAAAVPTTGDYTAAQVTNAADTSSSSPQTFTGTVSSPLIIATGAPSAITTAGYLGVIAAGPPTTGTYLKGDWVTDQNGARWTCTTAGTPGVWTQEPGTGGGGGGVTSFDTRTGSVTLSETDVVTALGSFFNRWSLIREIRNSSIGSATAAGTYVVDPGGAILNATGANGGFQIFRLDPAEYPAGPSGATPLIRLRADLLCNAVAPGNTITASLLPVTAFAGASGALPTVSTVGAATVSVAFATPAASSQTSSTSATANFPSAGWFILAIVLTGAAATNALEQIGVRLEVQEA